MLLLFVALFLLSAFSSMLFEFLESLNQDLALFPLLLALIIPSEECLDTQESMGGTSSYQIFLLSLRIQVLLHSY